MLKDRCDRILIYAYDIWLTRRGNLAGLAGAAGLRLLDGEEAVAAGLAEVA